METLQSSTTINRLRQLTSLAPSDPDLRLQLARELISQARFEEAEHEIRAAILIAPNDLEARKLLKSTISR